MPQYTYTVTDVNGQRVSGLMVASDREAALRTLVTRGLVVTRLANASDLNSVKAWLGLGQHRVKGEQLVGFTRQLASMLEAGITLRTAVEVILKECKDPPMRELLVDVTMGLAAGSSLTEVMSKHPKVFNDQYLALVAAGESGGQLPEILKRLANMLENADTLRRKVQASMYYPVFVMGFALCIVSGLLAFGVPRFESIYRGFGHELPWSTKLVVAVGNFLATNGAMLLVLLIIGGIALAKWLERPTGRLALDTVKLSIPIFGPLFQKLAIAHFCRTLATLHAAGVSITNALELVAGSMNNVVMERIVKGCLRDVMEGQSLVEPLRRSGAFTEMSITMLSAGEQAGAMDTMLHSLADYYENQVEIMLKGLMSLIEPVIIVFVGISIGMIVIAMMLPILNLATLVM